MSTASKYVKLICSMQMLGYASIEFFSLLFLFWLLASVFSFEFALIWFVVVVVVVGLTFCIYLFFFFLFVFTLFEGATREKEKERGESRNEMRLIPGLGKLGSSCWG